MKALLGQIDSGLLLDDRRQAAVVTIGAGLPFAVGPFFGEEILVRLLEVRFVVAWIELFVVLEILDVFDLGLLIDQLGLRFGAGFHALQLFVQAHDGLLFHFVDRREARLGI